MLRWITENKAWLFSGLGLAVLGSAWWALKFGYSHWRERRVLSTNAAVGIERRPIQYERVMRKRIVDRLPSFILRAALKPERVVSQIHIALRGDTPIGLSLNNEVPHIDLYFEITNLSPLDLVLDRMLVELWFGQPTFSSAILRRYVVPSGEITKNIYLRSVLNSEQRSQIQSFERPDHSRGAIHIYLTAYFESAVGRVEVTQNIERTSPR